MKRIIVEKIPAPGTSFSPSEDERHHLQDVRRVREGEELELLDGQGGLARARIIAVQRHNLTLEVLEQMSEQRESPLFLEMVLAIPSQLSTLDEMLPGLVQLGANRITLVPTAWGGRLKKDNGKYEKRLNTIAANALKQCGRTQLPSIAVAPDWSTLLNQLPHDCNILFHPTPKAQRLHPNPNSLGIFIGPEGGFTPEEVEAAAAQGIAIKALGPRILKMETAAIGAAYWAQSNYGDLSP